MAACIGLEPKPDPAWPSSSGVRETGCREAAMAVMRLFSGGASAPFHREPK